MPTLTYYQGAISLQKAFHGDAWTLSMLNMDTFIEKMLSFTHLQVFIYK